MTIQEEFIPTLLHINYATTDLKFELQSIIRNSGYPKNLYLHSEDYFILKNHPDIWDGIKHGLFKIVCPCDGGEGIQFGATTIYAKTVGNKDLSEHRIFKL